MEQITNLKQLSDNLFKLVNSKKFMAINSMEGYTSIFIDNFRYALKNGAYIDMSGNKNNELTDIIKRLKLNKDDKFKLDTILYDFCSFLKADIGFWLKYNFIDQLIDYDIYEFKNSGKYEYLDYSKLRDLYNEVYEANSHVLYEYIFGMKRRPSILLKMFFEILNNDYKDNNTTLLQDFDFNYYVYEKLQIILNRNLPLNWMELCKTDTEETETEETEEFETV